MKIFITGCYGQVGKELMHLAKEFECDAIGFDSKALDITDQAAVQNMVHQHKPDVVINAAAYTAVDKAEDDLNLAKKVNATAVGYLATACVEMNIPFVHISTDYVFDGSKTSAYTELDEVSPLSVYGETKLAGELAVQQICEQYYILRTSWVFSEHGSNFVKTILRLGAEREELSIVADQHGKPTSAHEIARTIYLMLTSQKKVWGLYHIAQPESTTWFGFAESIFIEAKKQGMKLKVSILNAIKSEDYPTLANRPSNSELNCSKLEDTFGINLKPWADSLSCVIKEL